MTDNTTTSSSTPSNASPDQTVVAPVESGWQLTQWEHNGSPVTLVSAVTLSLQLENGQASGSGGCNTFGASYRLTGDQITFDPLQATRIGCDEPISGQESQFFSALQSAHRLTQEGDRTLVIDYGQPPEAGRLIFTYK